ncbi:hypothetical protein BLNAU_15331 [Blattamonas nauphoetae]|uniref:Uncharacterized protein n=1 Tax=Blattamonas nauphoetae TaxID=2049346 RepID=A0ABQ9XEK2_9EUKA|nr:hypothetical protein BLNAU_15331 [Blattamonas nauphoetae]
MVDAVQAQPDCVPVIVGKLTMVDACSQHQANEESVSVTWKWRTESEWAVKYGVIGTNRLYSPDIPQINDISEVGHSARPTRLRIPFAPFRKEDDKIWRYHHKIRCMLAILLKLGNFQSCNMTADACFPVHLHPIRRISEESRLFGFTQHNERVCWRNTPNETTRGPLELELIPFHLNVCSPLPSAKSTKQGGDGVVPLDSSDGAMKAATIRAEAYDDKFSGSGLDDSTKEMRQ